ncbi:transposase [Neobacillus sp. MM2021_6]|nr:transposase [Neobacillus sp. MM2021_6]NHC18897.1 transposase [Bacillus sp. MM2020_4]
MRKDYSVSLLCKVLGASKSGYYAYLKRPKTQISSKDHELLTKIKRAYSFHKGTYGAKGIAKYISSKGTLVNHKKVARIMREATIRATVRRPKTTKEDKGKGCWLCL